MSNLFDDVIPEPVKPDTKAAAKAKTGNLFDDVVQDAPSPAPTSKSGKSGTPALPEGESATSAMSYMQSKGWTKEQAAGIVGNLYHESDGMKPAVNEYGKSEGKGGYGLAQWTGSRRKDLFNYAKERGEETPSFKTQLDFVNEELNGSEKKAGESLRKAKTPTQAAMAFSYGFERPGKPMITQRIKYAKDLYAGDELQTRNPGKPLPQVDDFGRIVGDKPTSMKDFAKAAAPYSKTVLPMAGATLGGLVAAPANAVAPGIAEVAGIALGGEAGTQLDRMLQKYAGTEEGPTKGEQIYGPNFGPWMDAGANLAIMAGLAPLGPEMASWGGGMEVLNNPAARQMEGTAAATLGRKVLSEETKVPLTPAQTGQAKSTTYLEGQLRKGMWSADEAAAFDAEQAKALQDYAERVQKTAFKGTNDPTSAGTAAKDSAWKRITAFRRKGGQIYDKVPVAPETPVETKNLQGTATEHMEELGKMPDPTVKRILGIAQKSETPATVTTSPIVDDLGRPIQTETPPQPTYTWEQLRADQSSLGKLASRTSDPSQRRIYNDLVRSISDDITAFGETVGNPEIKKQLDIANKYWRYGDSIFGPTRTGVDLPGMETFGRKQIKRLMKEESPEKIGSTFFKARPNRSDIRALREAAGEKGFNEIRQSWFEDMISQGEGGSFNHNKFLTRYEKYRQSGNLDEMLTGSQKEGLDKLYEISRSVAWSEKIAGNPSGTGHMVINTLTKLWAKPVITALEAMGTKKLAQKYFNDPVFQKKVVAGLRLPPGSGEKARTIARQLATLAVAEERRESEK